MNSNAPTTGEFTITRTFDARRELVWRAWTEESHLAQWLRPFGVNTSSIAFEVQVGGAYRYTMTNDETGETFPTGGTFLEQGERTERVFHLLGYQGEPGDGSVYDGWGEALTNLERYLLGRVREGSLKLHAGGVFAIERIHHGG